MLVVGLVVVVGIVEVVVEVVVVVVVELVVVVAVEKEISDKILLAVSFCRLSNVIVLILIAFSNP